MSTLSEITEAALQLSARERAQLMDLLQFSFENDPIDPETLAEVERRMEEIRSGKEKGISLEEFEARGRKLMARLKRDSQLSRMIAAITPENRHEEVDWGPPVGREVW